MALSTLTSRIDENDKQNFILFCDSVGLTSSAAVNMFVKAVIRERRIPFEISADPFYSESNMRYLSKVIDGIEDGTRPLVEHDLIEADDQ